MTIYLMVHSREFLAAQVASIRRHNPSDPVVIMRPFGTADHYPEFPTITVAAGLSPNIIRSIIHELPDEPSAVLEWDMVLTRPLVDGNAVNREPASMGHALYPSFLSWLSRADIAADYLASDMGVPFTADYETVPQDWIEAGDPAWPPCAADSHFRTLANGILHFQRGAGYRSGEGLSPRRRECWDQCMDRLDLPHMGAALPEPRPGLGDMVAAGLSFVGITKARVSAAVGGDCGCAKRQAAMNAAGAKWLGMPQGSTGLG